MSQDLPEVQSSGVPAPCLEDDRFVKNKQELLKFSLDMPWNPYKAPEW